MLTGLHEKWLLWPRGLGKLREKQNGSAFSHECPSCSLGRSGSLAAALGAGPFSAFVIATVDVSNIFGIDSGCQMGVNQMHSLSVGHNGCQ
jgi:hypothetical protein